MFASAVYAMRRRPGKKYAIGAKAMSKKEIMTNDTHDLIHILATVEINIKEQAKLHLHNVRLLKKANKIIDKRVEDERPKHP